MSARTQDRLFAAAGIAFVVLEVAGALVATAGAKTRGLTVSSTPAHMARAFATPATAASWVGAYLELLSLGAFLAFAVWATAKLGGGLLGSLARAAAVANAAVTAVSLALLAAVAYRAGHGLPLAVGRELVAANEALYVASWFLGAFFVLPLGLLAVGAGRRVLGTTALAIGVAMLAGAVVFDGAGQFGALLWFLWIVGTSVSLARGERSTPAPAALAHGA